MTPASHLVCRGCGASPPADDPYPFRCPNAGVGDVDHVVARILDPTQVRFPTCSDATLDTNPFVRYRTLLHSYHRASDGRLTDAEFVEMVTCLNRAVSDLDGRAFKATPFGRDPVLSAQLGFRPLGGLWVKDETGNVAGSHKARHLMGVLLHLEVAERIGLTDRAVRPDLAIASCGNAALAAAVIARAGGWHLRVFVPVDADPAITARLGDLGADVVTCARRPDVVGDPTYARLRDELAAGALPSTCQGSENGLVIEGGSTLGYEIVFDLAARGITLDHLVVQVGGGALASACVQAFQEAVDMGVLERSPTIHTVQTTSAHPLERCYRRIRDLLPHSPSIAEVARALKTAATHRSSFMWPWESEPRSIATGILDDETYDWLVVVGAMLMTGGRPVLVSEERLAEAQRLGRNAGYRADPTGTAGLAGLLDLRAAGDIGPDERVAVLLTGVSR